MIKNYFLKVLFNDSDQTNINAIALTHCGNIHFKIPDSETVSVFGCMTFTPEANSFTSINSTFWNNLDNTFKEKILLRKML